MPYATYAVQKFSRRTRAVLEVCAEGLTVDAARALASALRQRDAASEAAWGYTVAALPLRRQAELAEAAGLMGHAADPAPYALAA